MTMTLHRELAAQRGYAFSLDQERIVEQVFHGDYDRQPIELTKLFEQGQLHGDALSYALSDVWRYKIDNCSIQAEIWRTMFRASAFTVDGSKAQRPRWPVRIFRGATTENQAGLSWTTSLTQAIYFAEYRQDPTGPKGRVWTTVAPPEMMLARYRQGVEREYVVDASDLDIRPVDPSAHSVRLLAQLPAMRFRS